MAKLGAIARSYGISIVVVHHCRKPGQEGEGRCLAREPDRFIPLGQRQLWRADVLDGHREGSQTERRRGRRLKAMLCDQLRQKQVFSIHLDGWAIPAPRSATALQQQGEAISTNQLGGTMPVRRVNYWRVKLGDTCRWFADEEDARAYAKDRAADPENWDGIPFLDELTDRELIERINTLEASKQHRLGDHYV